MLVCGERQSGEVSCGGFQFRFLFFLFTYDDRSVERDSVPSPFQINIIIISIRRLIIRRDYFGFGVLFWDLLRLCVGGMYLMLTWFLFWCLQRIWLRGSLKPTRSGKKEEEEREKETPGRSERHTYLSIHPHDSL